MNDFISTNIKAVPKETMIIIIILVVAWLLSRLGKRLILVFRDYMDEHTESADDRRRIDTIASVFHYIKTVVISIIAGSLILSELGISIAPILGAAGVIGLAVGFGAQSLVKDYFTGFFLLLENQIRHGDVIEICEKVGTVENVTLRYVSLRDNEGNVHYVPNGQISIVTNKSRSYAYSLIDFGVAYREDLEEVYALIRKVNDELRNDPATSDKILEDTEIQGVQELADSAVTIRCRIKTVALEQWNIRRAFLGRLKVIFDKNNIEIPFPHLTLYAGQDKQGNSPAFRVIRQEAQKT